MCFFLVNTVLAQKIDSFKKLGGAEKLWVVLHPFSAGKAYEISMKVDSISKEMVEQGALDGDGAGGKVDAFRHALWMALLSKEIGKSKSRWLGKAHEKMNKRQFEKGELEHGAWPDMVSMQMDLHNNEVGIEISEENLDLNIEEAKKKVLERLHGGDMLIIKKDREGNSLDKKGEVIPAKEWEGKWENFRVLVPSDYQP